MRKGFVSERWCINQHLYTLLCMKVVWGFVSSDDDPWEWLVYKHMLA